MRKRLKTAEEVAELLTIEGVCDITGMSRKNVREHIRSRRGLLRFPTKYKDKMMNEIEGRGYTADPSIWGMAS